MYRFDRAAAAAYAVAWANHRNPLFPDFSGNQGGGGDCTNFVSQCMLAGGWPMIAPTWKSLLNWECTGRSHNDATRSWKIVREFARRNDIRDFELLCNRVGCGQVCTACHCDLKRFLTQGDPAPAEAALASGSDPA